MLYCPVERCQSYHLALLTPGGAELWSRSEELERIARARHDIALHVPAKLLSRGDYIFRLRLLTEDGKLGAVKEYPVRVERR
jgi:hypothetical protein